MNYHINNYIIQNNKTQTYLVFVKNTFHSIKQNITMISQKLIYIPENYAGELQIKQNQRNHLGVTD